MAIRALNSIGGFSVGETTANIILANGDITTGNATFTGNAAAANVLTDHLLYANGAAWSFTAVAGSNTQIQYNNDGALGASANFTFSSSLNVLTVLGNIVSTNANLGNSATANFYTGVLTTNAQPNITSVGTLSSLDVTGNISSGNANLGNLAIANFFSGNGSLLTGLPAGSSLVNGNSNVIVIANSNVTISSNGVANVVVVTNTGANIAGTLNATGNVTGANLITAGNVFAPAIVQNASTYDTRVSLGSSTGIIAITSDGNSTQFSPSGQIQLSGASQIVGGTFGGSGVTLGASQTDIFQNRGGNVTVQVGAGGTIANTWTFAQNGSFTSPGNISATGNLSAANANLGNLTTSNFYAGTLTTAAQPNITSVGTLTALVVTGTASAGNIATAGNVTASFLVSNVSTGTAPIAVASTTRVANLNVNYANVSDFEVVTAQTTGTYYPAFVSGSSTGNYALAANSGFSANLANGGLTATTFIGALSGAATTAGTVTTNAQPNITSVGTLTALAVTGNISSGNANLGNLTTSNYYTGTLTTAAQPNITSVGTLSSLDVTGTTTSGNFATAGNITASFLVSNVSTGTAPIAVTSTTRVANLNVNYANVADFGVVTAQTTGTFYPTFISGSSTGNYAQSANSNLSFNAATGALSATLFTGTLTTNAQPNVTSVGTLTSLAVTGNISSGNANLGNLTTSNYYTGTLTTAAQPNITSVGTLVNLAVTGNITTSANIVTDLIVGRTDGVTITAIGANASIMLRPTGIGTVDVGTFIISNVAEPNAASDAATKYYVDTTAQGLHIHASANAGTPGSNLATITGGTVTYNNGASGVGANLTTTGSLTLLDGVPLSSPMRLLIKNEANAAWNGIYVYNNTTVITRATDFDNAIDVAGGDFIFISTGSSLADTGWVQTTDSPVIIGTSPLVFTQFSGAGTYTAGTGLTLTGSIFSITDTAVTPGAYGNGDRVGTFTVNQQGQLTLAGSTVIAANAANLTGTVLNAAVVTSSLTSVGTLSSLTVTGTTTSGNFATAGNLTASFVVSNVSTGTAPLAVTSTTRVANLNVNYANVADFGVVTTQLSGTYYPVFVSGNTTANYAHASNSGFSANLANGALIATTFVGALSGAATTAGTVTTNAQPNITSVGTLSSLAVTGTTTSGNFATAGNITASFLVSNVATGTAPIEVASTTRVANLNVNYANVSDFEVVTAQTTGTFYPTFISGSSTANYALAANSGFSANIANGALIATTFVGALSGAATTAGTVTTAAQPNITSVGTLTTLIVGNATANTTFGNGTITALGNLSAANISTAGNLSANNANVSNLLAIGNTRVLWSTITTTGTTANQTLATFAVSSSTFTGVEFLVKSTDSTGSKYSIATVQAVTDGATVDFATFGTVRLGTSTGTLAVNIIAGPNIALQVTPASSNSTVWTTQYRFL